MKNFIKYFLLLLPFFGVSQKIKLESGSYIRKVDVYANSVADMMSYIAQDSTVFYLRGRFAIGDAGGNCYFQYIASSAATANDMTVIAPSSGGGRFIMQVMDGKVKLPQLGIFPNADNTTQINSAITLSANVFKLIIPAGMTYIVDPSVNGLAPINYTKIEGENRYSSQIKSKAYTGAGAMGKSMIYYVSTTIPLVGFSIKNCWINGNTTYSTGAIAGGSPVQDTTSKLISISNSDSLDISNNYITDGGNYAVVYYNNATNANISDNEFWRTGGTCIASDYDWNSRNIKVWRDKAHYIGLRNHWENSKNKRRESETFIQGGGNGFSCMYNEAWNETQALCFVVEARHWGRAEYIGNKTHAMGRCWGGYSLGNVFDSTGYKSVLNDFVFQDNIADGVAFDGYKTKDSLGGQLLYIAGFAYNEFAGITGGDISNNILPGYNWGLGRTMRNLIYHDNYMVDSAVNFTTFSGSGLNNLLNVGVNGTATDTIDNVVFRNNRMLVGAGKIAYSASGSMIKGFRITGSEILGVTDLTILDINNPAGGRVHSGISFDNNTVIGPTGFKYVFTNYTGAAPVIGFNNNDFTRTTIDTAGTFKLDAGTASNLNKEGSLFTTGLYSNKYVDSARLSGSSLFFQRNGRDAFTIALPGVNSANNGLNITAGAVGLGGTLTKHDTISGSTGSYGISFGTASDALNAVQIYSSALTLSSPAGIKLKTQLAFNAIATATDANYAGASNSAVILPVITANRTIDMTGYAVLGGIIVFMNKNTAAFTWSPINGTLKDPSGNTISSLVNNTNYIFIYDGTNYIEVGVSTLNGLTSSYVAKTTTYTATAADYTIDCTTGTFTVTLPTAVGIPGREYIIKNSGTGVITIATTSSQTIDGVTTKTLNVQYGGLRVQSNNANWIIAGTF